MLAEVQRIKSEGDFEAGKALVEKYAIYIDSPKEHPAKYSSFFSSVLARFSLFKE